MRTTDFTGTVHAWAWLVLGTDPSGIEHVLERWGSRDMATSALRTLQASHTRQRWTFRIREVHP